jgi:hypothetical protein
MAPQRCNFRFGKILKNSIRSCGWLNGKLIEANKFFDQILVFEYLRK